jgi:hypothetical protein
VRSRELGIWGLPRSAKRPRSLRHKHETAGPPGGADTSRQPGGSVQLRASWRRGLGRRGRATTLREAASIGRPEGQSKSRRCREVWKLRTPRSTVPQCDSQAVAIVRNAAPTARSTRSRPRSARSKRCSDPSGHEPSLLTRRREQVRARRPSSQLPFAYSPPLANCTACQDSTPVGL